MKHHHVRRTQMHRMGLIVTLVTMRIGMCVSARGGNRMKKNDQREVSWIITEQHPQWGPVSLMRHTLGW
jgi:hypothetical protein